jgi:methionyl-tRNA formyltransferase
MKILFIGKKNDNNAERAADYLRLIYPNSSIVFVSRGEKFDADTLAWSGDFLFSYLSPIIIPKGLLEQAKLGAINWHPGPPEYPGIGCTNFAIYEEAKQFGITCHFMLPKVDSGKVIEVSRFKVLPADTVYSITQKAYTHILFSFYKILECINSGLALPVSDEVWTRKPFTRIDLDKLSELTLDMDKNEMDRRINATTFDKPWAFLNLNGHKFLLG